jgi:outer membrane protein TolC
MNNKRVRTGPIRSDQVRSGPGGSGQVWTGPDRSEQGGTGWVRALVLALLIGTNAHAQQVPAPVPPPAPAPVVPLELVTFAEAVRRASTANPSIAVAAANILRAEGLLRQARAATLPAINAQGTNTTLDSGRGFNDQQLTSRNTFSAAIPIEMPLYAPAAWARRTQAQDAHRVAQADADDVRRQVAVAAAEAYLAVIAAHRVVEVQERSRDTAQAFYDFAHQRFIAGASSKLNELRAQQTFSTDQAAVEATQLALYRTQEALGVILAADRPVDASEEPAIESPPESEILPATDRSLGLRTDIKLFTLEVEAARRVVDDSRKEWLPSLTGIFQPEFQEPGSVFTPEAGWRALLQISMPLFDSGARAGRRVERQAALQQSEATLVAQRRQATSEIRSAYESVRRSERVVQSTRDAAAEAAQVLEITNISFRAGATTNIEVIDAQRRARDADTAAAVAEDSLRRARLDLLNALGRFP